MLQKIIPTIRYSTWALGYVQTIPAEAGPYKCGEEAVIQILRQAGAGLKKRQNFGPSVLSLV